MADNVLSSYLVSLGFRVEDNELKKFDLALKHAGDTATRYTTGVAQQFLKWQTGIVGAFAAVGLATIGLADKVADADLEYKIFATRMFLGVDAARRLKIATDALGYSLDDIAWNPELHRRFEKLQEDQKTLGAQLGPHYEQTMERIRDMRFELTRMQVAMQYVAMNVVQKLFGALGGNNVLERVQGWADWVIQHAPQISDWIVQHLVPVLKDAWRVMEDVWRVTEKLAGAFLRLVGAISGDDSLRDGTLNFDNFGKAIDHTADFLVKLIDSVTSAELVVVDMVTAVVDLTKALADLFHQDTSKFGKDWGRAKQDVGTAGRELTGGGAAVLGITGLGAILGAKTVGGILRGVMSAGRAGAGGVVEGAGAGGLLGTLGLASMATGLAAFAGSATNKGMQEWGWQHMGKKLGIPDLSGLGKEEETWENRFAPLRWLNSLKDGSPAAGGNSAVGVSPNVPRSGDIVASTASKYGISADLARAVAWAESRNRQTDDSGHVITSKAGAIGMFQLMKDTAAGYGVDARTLGGNVEGGVHLLSDLLAKYGGNVRETLAAYNWGSGHLDQAIKRHGGFALDYLPKETRDYIRGIEGRLGTGDMHVAVTVNVAHANATTAEIAHASKMATTDALRQATRMQLVNAQGAHS